MTPRPPAMPRAVLAVVRLGLRRWRNKLAARMRPRWRRKARGPEGMRQATGRRRSRWGPVAWLLVLLMPVAGVFLASQMLGALADHVDGSAQPGRMAVSPSFYEAIRRAESDAAEAGPGELLRQTGQRLRSTLWPFGTSRPPLVLRERRRRALERLDRQLTLEASRQARFAYVHHEELKERLRQVYLEKGPGGFYPAQRRFQPYPGRHLWCRPQGDRNMTVALGLFLSVLCAACLLNGLGSRSQDLGSVQWHVEWLLTFPARTGAIFLAEVIRNAVTNSLAWFLVLPFLLAVLLSRGWGWPALPLAVGMTLCLNLMLAGLQVVVEMALRKHLRLGRLKNLQAACTILGMGLFLLVVAVAVGRIGIAWLAGAARQLPELLLWLPWCLPMLVGRSGVPSAVPLLALPAAAAAATGAAVLLAERWARSGVVVQTSAYQGARGGAGARHPGRPRMPGLIGKEIRLLLRDRNYLAQTLIVPTLICVFQLALNPGLFQATRASFRHASALAFGAGAYALLFGGARLLTNEGGALWMLFTFPHDLEKLLRKKALFWGALATIFPAVILIVSAWAHVPPIAALLTRSLVVLVGVFLFSLVAGGIGVLCADPFETDPQRKLSVSAMYLLMLLGGLYVSAVYARSLWETGVLVTTFAAVTCAIWQKVRERVGYLLDPTHTPPPTISIGDALIAAYAFFAMQTLFFLAFLEAGVGPAVAMALAYTLAGAVVAGGSLIIFRARKVPDLNAAIGVRTLDRGGRHLARSLAAGVPWGLAAGAFAVVYLWAVERIGPLSELKQQLEQQTVHLLRYDPGPGRGLLVLLALFVAPVFEEYLFRGLLYGGLRRLVRPAAAMLVSAAAFAAMHQPIAVAPVFVLGVAAAMSYRRSGLLPAAIVTHLTYNAVAIAAASMLPRFFAPGAP